MRGLWEYLKIYHYIKGDRQCKDGWIRVITMDHIGINLRSKVHHKWAESKFAGGRREVLERSLDIFKDVTQTRGSTDPRERLITIISINYQEKVTL